jgi:hypothetical protein
LSALPDFPDSLDLYHLDFGLGKYHEFFLRVDPLFL